MNDLKIKDNISNLKIQELIDRYNIFGIFIKLHDKYSEDFNPTIEDLLYILNNGLVYIDITEADKRYLLSNKIIEYLKNELSGLEIPLDIEDYVDFERYSEEALDSYELSDFYDLYEISLDNHNYTLFINK